MRLRQDCPECGRGNPREARYCMNCGSYLEGHAALVAVTDASASYAVPPKAANVQRAAPAYRPRDRSIDWTAAIAAALAFLSLRRLSRGTRGGCTLLLLLMLFFGCPMVCGFVMFVMDWFARLFQ